LIDSAPIPVCTYGRTSTYQTAVGKEHFSVMPSRKAKLFGIREWLPLIRLSIRGCWPPPLFGINKVATAFLEDETNFRIWGDNAYHDPIELMATRRKDAKEP